SGLLILDSIFASTIIKIAFGDENAVVERRAFSNIELAVLDFFALCCLGEINQSLSEPLFKLRNVAQNGDALELDAKSLQNSRVSLYKFRLQLEKSFGIVELLLPFDLLKNLGESNNVLVKRRNRNGDDSRLAKIFSGFRLHVQLGETALNSSDLAFLEAGDVIIIERPNVTLNEANIEGNAQIRISDEASGSLFGELNTTERGLSFAISEISQNGKFSQPQRFRMQETFNENQFEDNDANASVALEKLTLTVNAEIASRRMTLHEIAQIRVGQVIELGSQVTDPIELVADGKTIAIGSLVNIEGNLGVRLTRVLV
ncbi:MAG: FliM/FliN family flagellar motor switch protein, partial [Pyrinomonadaceae bacterium]|nr:FliM/FliN family flagellar motor switch protein [Pyrinomonadaceae bacterium]